MADDCPVEPELGAGSSCPEPGDGTDLGDLLEKLCDLLELFIASDPDGDGILNVEIDGGMINVDLTGQCLTIANCEGESLDISLDPADITALADAIAEALDGLNVTIDPAILETLESILEKLCNPLEVVVTNDGPIEVILSGDQPDLTVDVDEIEIDCWVVGEPIVGCLVDECVTGIRFWKVSKTAAFPPEDLGNTLPVGAAEGPCPCVIEIGLPSTCCDVRIVVDTPGLADIPTLLGLGVGDTVPTFSLTVQTLGDKTVPATVVDCAGNESTVFCGENISYSGGCGDQDGTLQSITLAAGDRVVLEARICPPEEATP